MIGTQLNFSSSVGSISSLESRSASDFQPTAADVIASQCRSGSKHPGNRRYMEIVNKYRAVYSAAGAGSPKDEKYMITKRAVQEVQENGARFLRLDKDTCTWSELDAAAVHEKVSHALRAKRYRRSNNNANKSSLRKSAAKSMTSNNKPESVLSSVSSSADSVVPLFEENTNDKAVQPLPVTPQTLHKPLAIYRSDTARLQSLAAMQDLISEGSTNDNIAFANMNMDWVAPDDSSFEPLSSFRMTSLSALKSWLMEPDNSPATIVSMDNDAATVEPVEAVVSSPSSSSSSCPGVVVQRCSSEESVYDNMVTPWVDCAAV